MKTLTKYRILDNVTRDHLRDVSANDIHQAANLAARMLYGQRGSRVYAERQTGSPSGSGVFTPYRPRPRAGGSIKCGRSFHVSAI